MAGLYWMELAVKGGVQLCFRQVFSGDLRLVPFLSTYAPVSFL